MATKRVLFIDDEPDVRAVVQGCLEDVAGWEVITATSGRAGLVQVLATCPDAIVLDLMMPVMDGLSFLKALRNELQNPSIPVVLLTAKVNMIENPEFLDLGVEGILSKPFNPLKLAEQVAQLLSWDVPSSAAKEA